MKKKKAKINPFVIADGLLSIVTSILILLVIFDLYSQPKVLSGQISELYTEGKRVGKTYKTFHYLKVKSNEKLTDILITDKIYNSTTVGQRIKIELTPLFGLWNEVHLTDRNQKFQRHKNILFWLIGLLISISPLFNRKRWLSFNWGKFFYIAMIGKSIYFAVMFATII